MGDFGGGFSIGAAVSAWIVTLWTTWMMSREHKETLRILDDHMEWLRQFAAKKEGEEWKF